MSDRKNVKMSEESYQLLREEKREFETWDGMIHRVFSDD